MGDIHARSGKTHGSGRCWGALRLRDAALVSEGVVARVARRLVWLGHTRGSCHERRVIVSRDRKAVNPPERIAACGIGGTVSAGRTPASVARLGAVT